MRLLFIRHGDPDYIHDSLTEKGKREAELLAKLAPSLHMDHIYLSPLGRAQETAACSIRALREQGLLKSEPVTYEWLQEFPAIMNEDAEELANRAFCAEEMDRWRDPEDPRYHRHGVWDILPSYYTRHPDLFTEEGWRSADLVRASDAEAVCDHVTSSFDALLAEHGYVREDRYYRALQSNGETLAFFCHFGITAVFLSHLLHLSPIALLHLTCALPASVTEVVSEEREQGMAAFRMLRFGDTTHLTMGGEEPSFSARFCECFENADQRH